MLAVFITAPGQKAASVQIKPKTMPAGTAPQPPRK